MQTDHARGCDGRNYTCTCGYDESLRSRAEKAEVERYQLALAICGGEDAPSRWHAS